MMKITRPVNVPGVLMWGDFELDVRRREASWQGDPVALTPIEFRLMEVLILAGGDVVTVDELTRRLWGDIAFRDDQRLHAHVRRIRKKIERDPSDPGFLLTVRGHGYRLADWDYIDSSVEVREAIELDEVL